MQTIESTLKKSKGSEILFQTLQRAFFQARHLGLGNSQFRGDFCLRLALIVALVDNLGFLIAQMLHAFLQCDQTGKLADLIVIILDLIQQVQRVAVVVVDRLQRC